MVASPATATLVIEPPPTFAKEFAPDSILVGETSVLTFTIDNTVSSVAATALDFTDNLPAGLVVATPASASTTCSGGTFSASAGAGSVGYSGGWVGAGASCTLSVNVTAATPGAYANTTGDLTSSSGNSGSAMDTLDVGGAPVGLSKAFSPDSVGLGVVSTLTFTIDNTGNAAPATALDFDDIFPGGLVVASPSNLSTTCTGGTLTATSGGNTIDYAGGSVGAGASCTVEVDIANTTTGSFTNTSSELTSSLGNSGTATATLNVGGTPVGFSKAFAPDTIIVGGVSTLTFTIDNTANATPATLLDFTDNLPAELTLATPVNASTTCTGGTLTAAAGGSVISYAGGTAAASAACTVQADVTGTSVGSFANTSGDLTSSFGNSGSATATLVVNQDPNVIVEETMEVIRNFMNRRADLITVEDPDLTPLLDGPGLGPPLDASVYFDPNGSDFSFATSLSRLAYAATAGQREQQRQALAALGYLNGSNGPAVPRFDIWAQGSFTRYNDSSAGQSNEGYFGLLYLGAHYRVRPNLALGVLGQFDWTDEEDDSTGIGADGKGWLAGPYVVGRLGGNLYWQARGAWGTSDNNVTPFGTYTDDFQTTRWLASGKVEGRFYAGNWRFSPRAGLIYFEESQHSYVDSNGLTIPSQVVSLGRATFGPEVGYQMALSDGGYFEPSLGMSGIWDFDEDAKGLAGIVSGPEELRARVTGGFTFRSGEGLGFRASGFYDGIGDSEFEAYGGKLKLVVPIQ
jgi:hypothetical protein